MVTAAEASAQDERALPDRAGALPPYAAELRRGFLAMVPLWLGVVPFGVTFGVVAQQAGFGAIETQLGSMLIFAGSAQMAMVSLYDDGAAFIAIVLTTLVLNLRHVLYGLSLRRELPTRRVAAAAAGPGLLPDRRVLRNRRRRRADEPAARTPARRADAFLFGASISLLPRLALATLAGVTLGGVLPDAEEIGLELVFPLSFLALLLPLAADLARRSPSRSWPPRSSCCSVRLRRRRRRPRRHPRRGGARCGARRSCRRRDEG